MLVLSQGRSRGAEDSGPQAWPPSASPSVGSAPNREPSQRRDDSRRSGRGVQETLLPAIARSRPGVPGPVCPSARSPARSPARRTRPLPPARCSRSGTTGTQSSFSAPPNRSSSQRQQSVRLSTDPKAQNLEENAPKSGGGVTRTFLGNPGIVTRCGQTAQNLTCSCRVPPARCWAERRRPEPRPRPVPVPPGSAAVPAPDTRKPQKIPVKGSEWDVRVLPPKQGSSVNGSLAFRKLTSPREK